MDIYANAFEVTNNPATKDQDMAGNQLRNVSLIETFAAEIKTA
jgi:hypothetical protein